ncbi:MAG: alpha/beta hydrolase-fold protein [Acidobacteriota bacterium]
MRRFLLVLTFVLALPLAAIEPTVITIESKVLGETRTILVRTPASYAAGGARYPVLYLTDGDRQLEHTAATMDFLAREGRMPEAIAVGILNTDRTRDLTPTHVEESMFGTQRFRAPTSGGAGKFLQFLETEVIPLVESRYRTLPYRVFAGHSFGGLFAMHVFASKPKLFNAVLAVSPTLTWDNHYVLRSMTELVKSNKELNRTLVVTVGNEGPELDRELAALRTLLEKSAPKGLEWTLQSFADEDHGSVVMPSHYLGLRKIFAPWRFALDPAADPRTVYPRAKAHYAALTERAGYTIAIPEATANRIGYSLLQAGHHAEAIAVFKANSEAYPDSPNVYDSLGESYEHAGDTDRARESYERAWTKGKERNDPNTEVFKRNLDRLTK